MTPAEIIEAAREAGLWMNSDAKNEAIQRFAAIIEARQREKDAALCEQQISNVRTPGILASCIRGWVEQCAAAIRGQE